MIKVKIGLVSCLMKDKDTKHQLKQIEHYVSTNHNCDLICFGESFLQGFEGLTWEYDEDIKRALAKNYKCGISFGFIEKEEDIIYSSNMVIDSCEEIMDVF